jgi:hypothetical protein
MIKVQIVELVPDEGYRGVKHVVLYETIYESWEEAYRNATHVDFLVEYAERMITINYFHATKWDRV